ncbi:hypothetical protein BsWGS_05820 [Bradybaena similaris]
MSSWKLLSIGHRYRRLELQLIMKFAVCRRYLPWRILTLLVIIGTLTVFGLLTVRSDDYATAKLDNSIEPYWLDNLRNISSFSAVISKNSKYLFFSSELLTQNISKYEQGWFRNVSEENYLAANLSVFEKGNTIKNRLNDSYLIMGDNVCKGVQPFLLVIIPSVASNTAERDAIRWTWLRAAETNSWPRAFIRDHIKHIFLFGRQDSQRNKDYEQLLHESNIVGDIVMADFEDTYRNLTRKVLSGLSWVRQYCPQAEFVLKADQDTFINVPLMLEVIHKAATQLKNASFVMGLQHNHEQPLVVRSGRWAVSEEEYPLEFYPHYLLGHTYVLSRQAVVDIISTAPYVALISPEDAYITGILPKVAGVLRITAKSFAISIDRRYVCVVVWNMKVAVPEVKRPSLLANLWANIITHQCNDSFYN